MADLLGGQVSIITGAARGMGKEIARTYAREGASVGLLDVLGDELDQVVDEIQAEGGNAIGLVTDVRRYDQVEKSVKSWNEPKVQLNRCIIELYYHYAMNCNCNK